MTYYLGCINQILLIFHAVKENSVTVAVKELQIVYVRGDLVIMVSPQQNQV